MKKITYVLALISLAMGAQNSIEQDSGQNVPISQRSASQAVIFDQPSVGGNGIVSDVFLGIPGAVYSADDFTIDAENVASIETVTVFGFQPSGNLLTTVQGLDLFIYADDEGVPAGDPSGGGEEAILTIENLAPDDPALIITETLPDNPANANSYDFTVDIAAASGQVLNLEGGTYWIVVAPRFDVNETNSPDRWNWFDAGAADVGAEAHLIDIDDLFGGGFTSWTAFSALGLTFGSTAFLIEGTETLSVGNDSASAGFSLYPNPTTGILTINTTQGQTPTQVVVYDLLGKEVKRLDADLENLDITDLSNGLYVVEILGTNNTKTTQKVVKQ